MLSSITEELLSLENSRGKKKDTDISQLCKEKVGVQMILDAELTAKENLARQLHSMQEWASK